MNAASKAFWHVEYVRNNTPSIWALPSYAAAEWFIKNHTPRGVTAKITGPYYYEVADDE